MQTAFPKEQTLLVKMKTNLDKKWRNHYSRKNNQIKLRIFTVHTDCAGKSKRQKCAKEDTGQHKGN
jgi:hypothetical protein